MSIERTASGKWRAVVTHGRNNKKHSPPFATRDDALMAEARLKVQMGSLPKPDDSVTVRRLLVEHIENGKSYSPTTLADYRRVLTMLPPEFLRLNVSKVTTQMIDNLYRDLGRSGRSAYRIRRTHEVLSGAFKRAHKYRWTLYNPCSGATRPAVPKRTLLNIPDDAKIRELMAEIARTNPALGVFTLVAANTGARRGELVALKWTDLTGNRLSIRRSLADDPSVPQRYTIKSTKTGSERSISLSGPTVEALESLGREGSWIFSHDRGATPWHPTYPTRAWGRLQGRDGVRLHDLRHAMATRMLNGGVDYPTVSARLGHDRVSTTLDIYSHVVEGSDLDAAERFSI